MQDEKTNIQASDKVFTIPKDKLFAHKSVRSPLESFATTLQTSEGWVYSEYDLADPYRIADTESIFRQSVEKKVSLAFKHGYEFTSKNKTYLKYIKARFAQIAFATGTSTVLLIRHIFRDLATCNNAFIIKVRDKKRSGGRIRKEGTKSLNPVAGYFVAHPSTMQPKIKNKKIVKWRHLLPTGKYKEFNPEDVIHFHSGRRAGFYFAPPLVTPVKDDIRALRKIEENVELMLYQYLFPLFHYTVGTDEYPAGVTEDGKDEIEVARDQLYQMTAEGGIVTSHRHKIELLGIDGRQMRAEEYLKHFQRRVLGGIGLSEIDLGISDSANRSTAESFSRSLVDAVKDIQLVVKETVENEMINELLLESGLIKTPMDLFDEDKKVSLNWHEIDIDYFVKIQNHHLDVFLKNGITYTELRQELGRDPIKKGSKEALDLQWEWFEKPSLLIRAVDEPYLDVFMAKADGIEVDESDVATVQKQREKMAKLNKATQQTKKTAAPKSKTNVSNKVKPTNQHGSSVPVPPKKDALDVRKKKKPTILQVAKDYGKDFLKKDYRRTKNVVLDFINSLSGKEITERDKAYIKSLLDHEKEKVLKKLRAKCYGAYRFGRYGKDKGMIPLIAIDYIDKRTEKYVGRFYKAVYSNISKAIVDNREAHDTVSLGKAIKDRLDALEFRVEAISHVEPEKAYAYGEAHSFLINNQLVDTQNPVIWKTKTKEAWYKKHKAGLKPGEKVPVFTIEPGDSACDRCEFVSETIVNADPYDIFYGDIDKFVPIHPNCNCKMVMEVFDWTEEMGEEVQDGKKLESCVSKVKTKMKEKHPNWSDKKAESSAWAICKSKGLK